MNMVSQVCMLITNADSASHTKEAIGSSCLRRFIRNASISSSVGSILAPPLCRELYGLLRSSIASSLSMALSLTSSAISAWKRGRGG
jgi:hypothetical protein